MAFNNRANAKQLIDFENLTYGSIQPTDIDGFIEYHNVARVYLEYKYKNATMPNGQKLALERAVDDARMAGKEAVLFLCSHDVPSERDVDAAEARVTMIYWNSKWYPCRCGTVKEWTDRFIGWVDALTRS